MRQVSLLLCFLTLPLLVGCGDGMVEVTGTVTVEGAPVEEGRITFLPAGEAGTAEGARIENGNYSARVKAGEHSVEISGQKQVGMEKPPFADESTPEVPVMKDMVPPKYQRESPLKATVTAGMEPLNFELDAK